MKIQKITLIPILIILWNCFALSQTEDTITLTPPPSKWTNDMKVQLNLEEGAYSNWINSGLNYLSTGIYLMGRWNYKSTDTKLQFLNSLDALIGTRYQEESTDGWRKTDDRIQFSSSGNYKVYSYLNANLTADLRSYFMTMHTKDSTIVLPDTSYTRSDTNYTFLDPTTIMLAMGVNFIKDKLNIQFNPISERLIVYTGATPNEHQFGSYFKMTYSTNLDSNITFAGRLENFYQYGKRFTKESFWNLELRFDGKINKWLSAGLVIEELLDTKQSMKLQSREKITLGVTYYLLNN